MFSGIVEATGRVRTVGPGGGGLRVTIEASFSSELALGESVCVSGVCLTVVSSDGDAFDVEISPETVRRSRFAKLAAGERVNLERSLRLGDRLSGHLVFGHVDGVGAVESIAPEGDSALYRFSAPPEIERYLVEKGSVSVDGVSLTVFACHSGGFSVGVIPHTAAVTTLGDRKPGDLVNLESDMIARYVEKLLPPR